MEKTKGISRARFLAGAAALSAAATVLPSRPAAAAAGLGHRGVVYTVGEGETPGTAWSAAREREVLTWSAAVGPTPRQPRSRASAWPRRRRT